VSEAVVEECVEYVRSLFVFFSKQIVLNESLVIIKLIFSK
jgi:hypothetical protein